MCSAVAHLVCRTCGGRLASTHDIFDMSVEGPLGAYVNPHGYVHETVTVRRVSRASVVPVGMYCPVCVGVFCVCVCVCACVCVYVCVLCVYVCAGKHEIFDMSVEAPWVRTSTPMATCMRLLPCAVSQGLASSPWVM